MQTEDANFVIVYNGEVYNFRELRNELGKEGFTFFSHSDTEVVLKSFIKWGPGCLEHFNGMFALAIFDKRKQEVFIARDRYGIKPLYYF